LVAIAVAFLAVSFQRVRAALANPAESLVRSEEILIFFGVKILRSE